MSFLCEDDYTMELFENNYRPLINADYQFVVNSRRKI